MAGCCASGTDDGRMAHALSAYVLSPRADNVVSSGTRTVAIELPPRPGGSPSHRAAGDAPTAVPPIRPMPVLLLRARALDGRTDRYRQHIGGTEYIKRWRPLNLPLIIAPPQTTATETVFVSFVSFTSSSYASHDFFFSSLKNRCEIILISPRVCDHYLFFISRHFEINVVL